MRDLRTNARSSSSGFGLIELMITIAIVAILATLALPSYRYTLRLNRLTTDVNNLLAAMNLARNEAASRGKPVTVCASTTLAACDGPATSNWSNGWIVFTDYAPTGQIDPAAGDEIIRVFEPVAAQNNLSSTGNVGYVTFGRTGAAEFANGDSFATFTLYAAPFECALARTINITNLGRTKSQASVCP